MHTVAKHLRLINALPQHTTTSYAASTIELISDMLELLFSRWVAQVHTFEKPWFTSAEGAMACALCIIPFFWLRRRRCAGDVVGIL